ncbi:hypothetical protein KKF84_15655 [Myxococcota bacterium]|nr:hypothetical protein [Myxococcota bacterium]
MAVLCLGSIMVATKPAEFFLKQAYKGRVIDLFQATMDKEMEWDSRQVLDTLGRVRLDVRLMEAAIKGSASKELEKPVKYYKEKANLDFLFVSDKAGNVLVKEPKMPTSIAGFESFKEAMAGYHSDNSMEYQGELYQTYSVPILSKDHSSVVGAIVGLRKIDAGFLNYFLERLGYSNPKSRNVELAIFNNNKLMHATKKGGFWGVVPEHYKAHSKEIRDSRQGYSKVVTFTFGDDEYGIIMGMLRGAATNPLLPMDKALPPLKDRGIYYVVSWRLPMKMGPFAFLDKLIPQDKLLEGFPWVLFIVATLVFLILGIMIIMWEGDMPVKRMIKQAKAVGEGEYKLINDADFSGRFGSLARAINEALEKAAASASPDAALHAKSMDDILGDSDAGPKASLPDGGPPPPPVQGKPLNYPNLKKPGAKELPRDLPPLPITKKEAPAPVQPEAQFHEVEAEPEEGVPLPPAPDDDPGEYYAYVTEQFRQIKLKLDGNLDGFDEIEFMKKLEQSTQAIREKTNVERVELKVYERDGQPGLKAVPLKS